MRFGAGSRLALAVGLTLLSLSGAVRAQADKADKKGDFKRVSFKSADSVELRGTFYAGAGGKTKDACVLLLHDFDSKKGGSSHQEGWDRLAEALQQDGYAVLTFDFRGFGDSKTVSEEFWKFPQNKIIRGATRKPDTIEYKDFPSHYYPNLVNDIVAAKAFLDRRNDVAGDVNTSNLIVIGAGDGATLGAMWMATQCALKPVTTPFPITLGDAECKDVACGVWLTISPTLAGRGVPVKSWLMTAGRENKIPMAFIYGKNDARGSAFSVSCFNAVKGGSRSKNPLPLTGTYAIADTKLAGSALLQKGLDTEKLILKDYLHKVMEKRGVHERRKREIEKTVYYWVRPGRRATPANRMGEEVINPVPLYMFMQTP